MCDLRCRGRRVYVEQPMLLTVVRSGRQDLRFPGHHLQRRREVLRGQHRLLQPSVRHHARRLQQRHELHRGQRHLHDLGVLLQRQLRRRQVPAAQHHLSDGRQSLHRRRDAVRARAARASAGTASARSARRSASSPATSAPATSTAAAASASKATGATEGVCRDVATTGAGNCAHDGDLCNGCGSLLQQELRPLGADRRATSASRASAARSSTASAPATASAAAAATGQVHCSPTTGGNLSIGVCSTNTGNQVPGGICRLTGGANACSNAQSDCTCAVSPKAQCCAYDTLGLPRCLGSGTCSADGGHRNLQGDRIPSAAAGRPDVQYRLRVLWPHPLRSRLDGHAAMLHPPPRRRHRFPRRRYWRFPRRWHRLRSER